MIIADASLIVKAMVLEEGSARAQAEIDAAGRIAGPALLFSEVGNVLRRKRRAGLISVEQYRLAGDLVPAALDLVLNDSELVIPALHLSEEMNHSVYDCIYLAAALETGAPLVSADAVFVRKCAAHGFGAMVKLLADEGDARQPPMELPNDWDRLVTRMEEMWRSLVEAQPRGKIPALRWTQSELDILKNSLPFRRVSAAFDNFEPEDQAIVLALCWLSRGHEQNWQLLVDNARRLLAEGWKRHETYVLAQLPRLAEGVKKFRDGQVTMTRPVFPDEN